MPDDQDYADLGRLLASPESWTDAELTFMRGIRRNQADVLSGWHPKDTKRISALRTLLHHIDVAIARREAHTGPI